MSDPSFTIPSSTSGASSIASSDAAQQQAKFYGQDIWYDVSRVDPTTGTPDYVVNGAGDWTVVTEREALGSPSCAD